MYAKTWEEELERLRLCSPSCMKQSMQTEACDWSFQLRKGHLPASPVLAFPNADESFILDTDASKTGVGAVLSQQTDECETVVAYYSRTRTKTEHNYCVTRWESLAVILAIRNFRHYLLGKSFRVHTNHGALQWLMDFHNPDGQMARWLEELSMYEFSIKYRRAAVTATQTDSPEDLVVSITSAQRKRRKKLGLGMKRARLLRVTSSRRPP